MNKLTKKIVLILLYIMSIMFLYHITSLNILTAKYVTILFIAVILLALINTLVLVKNKLISFIFTILCIILSIGYLISSIYFSNTKSYVFKATNNDNNYKTYNVIALKASEFNKIEDIKDKNIGFLKIDPTLELSIDTLNKKVSINDYKFDDIDSLYQNLYNNKIDALSIEKSYIDTLEESESKYLDNTKVIYTYKIKVSKIKETKKTDTNKPFILYISGSDSRSTVKAIARSDVNIVMTVNPKTHKILLVHIPRDYYVQLHGTTGVKDKLTHAGVYGIDKSITTIEDLLDINIDKYVKVSFATVINSVDILDGIDIYSEKSFTPWCNRKCKIVEGTQHLNGKCALAFARERRTYTTGDRHRGENQEQVLSKIIEKMTQPKYLTKYNEILKATENSFETNMTYEEVTNIVKHEIETLGTWNFETYNLDGVGDSQPTYSMGSMLLYVMQPDQNTIDTAKQKIKEYLE